MGAREEVNWKMTADTGEVVRAWQQMVQGQERCIQKMDQLGRKARESGETGSTAMQRLEDRFFSAATSANVMLRAVSALVQAQRELNAESAKAELDRDTTFSNFRIQAGLTGAGSEPAAQAAKQSINASADRAGVSLQQADQAATQLISSGVELQDVLGGALDKFLDVGKSMNAMGKDMDPRQAARAAGLLMNAGGVKKDAAGFERFGRTMTGLFETNVELADLETFAPKAGAIRQMTGQTMEEMTAAFAVLRDQMGADEASTGFKTFVQRLGPGKTRAQKKAIESLGLKPEDIDLVGETLPEVIERLKAAMAKVDEATGKEAFKRIFGAEGMAAGAAFLSSGDNLQKYTALTQGRKFDETAEFARGTLGSRKAAAEAGKDARLSEAGQGVAELRVLEARNAVATETGNELLGKMYGWMLSAGGLIDSFLGGQQAAEARRIQQAEAAAPQRPVRPKPKALED